VNFVVILRLEKTESIIKNLSVYNDEKISGNCSARCGDIHDTVLSIGAVKDKGCD
jgi:hypothetical protein